MPERIDADDGNLSNNYAINCRIVEDANFS